jgi:transposase
VAARLVREVQNAIFYVLRTGSPWRDLPERYGPFYDGLQPLQPLGQGGVWMRIFEALAALSSRTISGQRRSHGSVAGQERLRPLCRAARQR